MSTPWQCVPLVELVGCPMTGDNGQVLWLGRMPWGEYYRARKLTWRTMKRWQRKQWYRDNQTRVARGQKPLPKP